MRLFVEVLARTLTLDVDGSDTVLALRAIVSEACNIDESCLYIWSPWEDLTDDTLESLGVVEGMTLRPIVLLTLLVHSVGGRACSLEVDSDTGIEHVKHLVCVRTGIPIGEQRLFFGLVELQDDDRLDEHDIVSDSVLQLVRLNPLVLDG